MYSLRSCSDCACVSLHCWVHEAISTCALLTYNVRHFIFRYKKQTLMVISKMNSFEGLHHRLNQSCCFFFPYFKGYKFIKLDSPSCYICREYRCTLNQRLTFLSFMPVNWIEFAQHHRKPWEQRLNYIPSAFKAALLCHMNWTEHRNQYILRLVLNSQTQPRCTQFYACVFEMKQLGREIVPSKCVCNVWEI